MMGVEQDLYQSATALIETRYPVGWGGAAAVRLASGEILTSVAPDTDFDALSICMELGSLLEAHKRAETVTHSVSSIGKVIFGNAIYRSRFGSGGHISPCWVVCSSRGLAREFASTANRSMRPLIMFCAA